MAMVRTHLLDIHRRIEKRNVLVVRVCVGV